MIPNIEDIKFEDELNYYFKNEEMSFNNNPEIQLKMHIENIEKLDIKKQQQINDMIQQRLKEKEKEKLISLGLYHDISFLTYDAEKHHREVTCKIYEEFLQEEFNKYEKPKIQAQLEEIKRHKNKQKWQEYYNRIEEKIRKEEERKKQLIMKVYTELQMQHNGVSPHGYVNDYYITGELNGWTVGDLIDTAEKIMYKH